MAYEEYYDDELIIVLAIDGSIYEEEEVKVSDPTKSIREQISSIVNKFELPQVDNAGNPIEYLLGQTADDGDEIILEFEDVEGRELSLLDYNIQRGDRLHLVSVPIPG